jgi:hypothetical protein
MSPVYSLLLALDPKPGRTAADCFDALASAAVGWVEAAHPGLSLRTDGTPATPTPDATATALRERIDPAHELFTLDWTATAHGVRYAYAAELARTPVGIQGRAAVKAGAVGGLAPVGVEPFRPAVVDRWAEVATARAVGGEEVPAAVRAVGPRFVAGFVDDLLLAPNRVLPLVVLTPLPDGGRPLVEPAAVLDAVYGLAHVVELTHRDATFELTNRVGKEWSCFVGGVRLYWPAPSLGSDFRSHPLFLPAEYRDSADAADRLPRQLLAKLAPAAVARFTESPLVRQVRGVQEKLRQAAVQRQIKELSAGAAESKDWLALLESEMKETTKLRQEVELLKLELAEVTAERDDLREQFKTVGQETAAAEDAAVRAGAVAKRFRDRLLSGMKTVSEAVDLAADEFADTLRFLPAAVKAAADSPYLHPDKVYKLFRALDEIGRTIRTRGELGETLFDALQRHGFEYKPHISVTSEGRFGDEYTFEYGGRRRLFENHVTLGSSHSPRECLSVHWLRDEAAGRFIIGWCGRHLTNTRS